MQPLDDPARRMLKRALEGDEPTADRLALIEAGLHQRIAAGDPGTVPDATGVATGVKLTLVVGVMATVVVAAILPALLTDRGEPRSDVAAGIVEPGPVAQREAVQSPVAAEQTPPQEIETKEIRELAQTEPALTPPAPEVPASPVRRARASPSASSSVPPPASRDAEDALEAELRLMRSAMSALRGERWEAALEAFDRHAERFPEGALADERDVGRAEALCGAGRTADGLRRIDEFLRARPKSPLRGRARRACET